MLVLSLWRCGKSGPNVKLDKDDLLVTIGILMPFQPWAYVVDVLQSKVVSNLLAFPQYHDLPEVVVLKRLCSNNICYAVGAMCGFKPNFVYVLCCVRHAEAISLD